MVDLHRQYLDIRDEVDRAIGDVIAETAFIKGPAVGLFEEELARRLEVRHCIGLRQRYGRASAVTAGRGLRGATKSSSRPLHSRAVTETVLLLGGVPVFADVDPRTFNIAPGERRPLVSERTRVVIPVICSGSRAIWLRSRPLRRSTA